MKATGMIAAIVSALAWSCRFSAAAAEGDGEAVARARAAYEAAGKVAQAAYAAIAPKKAAMTQADAAYAAASKAAAAKRQQAIDSRNLAGESGVRELRQAEDELAAAVTAASEAARVKPAAEKALAEAKEVASPLQQAYDAAEKAAKGAEAVAKAASSAANKSEEEANLAGARAAALRRAADVAAAALARAQRNERQAVARRKAIEQKSGEGEERKAADEAVMAARKLLSTAIAATQESEPVAHAAAVSAGEKNQRAAQVAARRKAAGDAAAALSQAQQGERHARAQADLAAKALTDATAHTLAKAEAQKKAADVALVGATNQVAAATAANRAAQDAAGDILQLDAVAKQAAADAAANRRAADAAKAALAPVRQKLEQATTRTDAASQELTRSQARKKAAEEAVPDLRQRMASARQTQHADEEAARAAEAVAAPLKAEADRTRVAYAAVAKLADDKRVLAEQAKFELYRLVASGRVPGLMESADPPKPANKIDAIIFAKLKLLDIQPVLCSDAVFVRRAYLDVTGRLPSADEARAFIQGSDKNKRVALIDHLLDQPAHADYWAMKWSDILKVKAEFPVKVWPKAAQVYHRWIWEAISRNKPYDRFARELVTSSGSNFQVGPVNFYRAIQDRTPGGIAAAAGVTFMGVRIHAWPDDRRTAMAAFFSQVGYKPTSEWKEEIVFWDPLGSAAMPGCTAAGVDDIAKAVTATNQIPRELVKPVGENVSLSTTLPDGVRTTIPADRDPREVFADWLIQPDNRWFSRAIVNRTWAWIMGRGIIHEPDDIRDDNLPSNQELLAYLEKELVSSGWDLKHIERLILTSTAYQFSSIQRFKGPEARANFASYPLRRLEAEVLIDALNSITGGSDLYTSAVPEPFTYIPRGMSAVQLADGSVTSSFLTLFGRSSRATGMENERVNELASTQWLHMLNSTAVQNKLVTGPKLAAIVSAGRKPGEVVERLYLTILSRFPTDADIKTAGEYAGAGTPKGRDAMIDLAWALINSPEFLLRH